MLLKFIQVYAISRITFQEILRDKVLLNIVLLSALLLGISFAASQLTFLSPERVIIDFGFTALNLSGLMIAVFHCSGMVQKEFDRRTIFVALARPISHFQFLLGKLFGLFGILILNCVVLSIAIAGLYRFFGGTLNSTFFVGLMLLTVQSLFFAGLTLVAASFSTASETVIIMIGLYLIGNNISEIDGLISKIDPGILKSILKAVVFFLPNLENFNLGFTVTYGLPVSLSFVLSACSYACFIITASLLVSSVLIQRRE